MKKILPFLLFFPLLSIHAQSDTTSTSDKTIWKNISIQAMYQNGHVFATNEFLRGANIEAEKINAFQAFSVKVSTQTSGSKDWEQLYKYPYWGAGAYIASFYNPEEIGVPIAIYGFVNAPFIRKDKFTFNYEMGLGLMFNWKSFDPITNKYNSSIGAEESVIVDAGLNLAYALTDNFDISAGFSLSHFSNGALKKPNLGLNTIAPRISIKYNFYDPQTFTMHEITPFSKKNEWTFSIYGGAKNVIFDTINFDIIEKYEGVYYPELGFSLGYNRQISHKSKIGLGITSSFDGSVEAQIAIDHNEIEPRIGKFSDKLLVSVYPSYELVMHKVSIILQPSFYIFRQELDYQSPAFHQRIGIKYHFTDHLFAGITLRAYKYHVSDFIEWTLGYRILQ
jgi:hypothetical protein